MTDVWEIDPDYINDFKQRINGDVNDSTDEKLDEILEFVKAQKDVNAETDGFGRIITELQKDVDQLKSADDGESAIEHLTQRVEALEQLVSQGFRGLTGDINNTKKGKEAVFSKQYASMYDERHNFDVDGEDLSEVKSVAFYAPSSVARFDADDVSDQ